MAGLKIEQWPIEKLTPYARNPRKNEYAVPKMASLIKEFGFKVPVVARSDGSLVDGHLRLRAAQYLGMETVPVVLADEWTEAQVKAFRLAVNKSAELAEWDAAMLKLEVEDLKEMDFDMDLIGFDAEEISNLEDTDYGHIDDLMEEALGEGSSYNEQSDIFGVTFNFQREQKEMIENFLKKKTKSYVVEMIIREAEKVWQE